MLCYSFLQRKETVGQPVSTQQEKVSKVLDDVKNGVSIVEEPLEDVLNKCQADRRGTYYEAKRLLAEVCDVHCSTLSVRGIFLYIRI